MPKVGYFYAINFQYKLTYLCGDTVGLKKKRELSEKFVGNVQTPIKLYVSSCLSNYSLL
jgi:hypothetical protein